MYSEIFKIILDNASNLIYLFSSLAGGVVFCIAFIRRQIFSTRIKEPKALRKYISYKVKYRDFLNSEDDLFFKEKIRGEIFRDAVSLPAYDNRDDLIYIYNRLKKKNLWRDLCRVQNFLEIEDDKYVLTVPFLYSPRVFAIFGSALSAVSFLLTLTLAFLSLTILNQKKDAIAFLVLMLIFECLFLFCLSSFPLHTHIKKLKSELEYIPARRKF